MVKTLPPKAGDVGSVPGSGRSPGEENGNTLQYSCLGNRMDRLAWKAAVHGVSKSQTRLVTKEQQRHTQQNRVTKGPSSQGYAFSSGHVWM